VRCVEADRPCCSTCDGIRGGGGSAATSSHRDRRAEVKRRRSGFDDGDLQLLWDALSSILERDRSAARGQMSTRGLYVFEHDSELGNAHAHELFDRLVVQRKADADGPARDFGAYSVTFDGRSLALGERIEAAPGVTLHRRC
jgi:CRISPR-associated protein Csd2